MTLQDAPLATTNKATRPDIDTAAIAGTDASADASVNGWAEAPAYFDVLSRDGLIVHANATQERALGYLPGGLSGARADLVYPRDSRATIAALFTARATQPWAEFVRLSLRRRDREIIEVSAHVNFYDDPHHGPCARLVKTRIDPVVLRAEAIQRDHELLASIIETSKDACWCIEFPEPVDLTAPDREVVRQVFENKRTWRYCNQAMAELYNTPDHLVFNERSVDEVFPNNLENKSFVQTLLDNNFHVDGALSRDTRYDGLRIYVENDVRGDIRNGHLYRMWGTARDLSKHMRREQELEGRANAIAEVLGGVPDPILVVSGDGMVEGANPAVEWSFGWQVDRLLGTPVERILSAALPTAELLAQATSGGNPDRQTVRVQTISGDWIEAEANLGLTLNTDGPARAIIALRVRPGRATHDGPPMTERR